MADAGNKIYAAASNGIFTYNKEDNSLTTISTLQGLQEENISAIGFNRTTGQLLVGYVSGNLDIIKGNEIFNIDLLSTSQIVGSKTINDIVFNNQMAFLITDFGALKFDLNRLEVVETYRELSQDFGTLKAFEAAIFNDSIFIVCEEGVLSANVSESVNLLDPDNWFRFGPNEGIPQKQFDVITATNSGILVGSEIDGLFFYNQNWTELSIFQNEEILSLTSLGDDVLLVADSGVFKASSSLEFEKVNTELITNPNDAILDGDKRIWISDRINGALTDFSGAFVSLTPSGPFGDKIFRLRYVDQRLLGLPGGYDRNIRPLNCDLGFYSFENGFWTNFNAFDRVNPFPYFNDITNVVEINERVIFSSASDGLLDLKPDGSFDIINHLTPGSPLQNTGLLEDEIIVPSILHTNEGIWVINYAAASPLHLLRPDNTWISYNLPSRFIIDLIDVGNTLWILPNPENVGGIIVFDKETNATRFLSNVPGNGGLAGREVRTLALDLDGLVWAGTDDGVSVFTNPFNVLNGEVEAIEPIFNNRLLLRGEVITVIEIDGGNQKWIGTRNGVWLFDDQADNEIYNFTVENSPLPSNNILDIEINPATGEVFFATDVGMVSFRGEATQSRSTHSDIEIFPNPVTHDFTGQLGISGLATDVNVKITDVSGKLIFETQANGGTATWNISGYNGQRADSGIYFVFSSSSDGEETYIGKIAVID